MKSLKITTLAATLLTMGVVSQHAAADLSANVGVVSQYHFRGIQQTTGASASAGLDYANGGFYAGVWTADVADGLEIDGYFGYDIETEAGLTLGANYTTYQYTGDFDSAYNEIGLSAGMGKFSLGYVAGKWDGVVGDEAATESDYSLLTLGFEHEGFSLTFGTYGKDTDGEYGELSYGTEIGGFDVGVTLVVSGSELDNDEALYFSLSKSFDL